MCDSRRGFELEVGFIDKFNTQLVTTLNYSAIASFHSIQFTGAHAKSLPACSVFTSNYLATASASGLKSSLNGGSLPTVLTQSQSQSYFTTGGLPANSLGVKPLETHDQHFFFSTEYLIS
jgi:hypothetical protein